MENYNFGIKQMKFDYQDADDCTEVDFASRHEGEEAVHRHAAEDPEACEGQWKGFVTTA